MDVSFSQVVVWLVVGGIAGSFVGAIFTRSKEGYGRFRNLSLGLAGALIGGLFLRLFNFDFGLEKITISAADLVAAVAGSALLVVAHGVWKRTSERKAANKAKLTKSTSAERCRPTFQHTSSGLRS